MNDSLNQGFSLPPEQQAIRDKCFHPSGTFVEFPIEDVETSIPARFEKIVEKYPEQAAIKIGNQVVTYAELNGVTNQLARVLMAKDGDGNKPVALLFRRA